MAIEIELKEVFGKVAGNEVTGRDLCREVRLAEPSAPMWGDLDKSQEVFALTMDGAKCFCIMLNKRVRQIKERPNRYNHNTDRGFYLFLGAMSGTGYIPLLISLYWEIQGQICGEEFEEDFITSTGD